MLEKMKADAEQPNPAAKIAADTAQAELDKTRSETALNLAKVQAEETKPLLEAAKIDHQADVRAFDADHSADQNDRDRLHQAALRAADAQASAEQAAAAQTGEPQAQAY
ncbi:MAG: hypothetical protein EON48_15290 [Acetobacteraceae bacterium]|nr:MAG: hypothetical protein EON48_15290 [Acetobacteraceae bacterium]